MPYIEQRPTRTDLKAVVLPLAVAIGLITVFFRLWYLQIVKGEELSNLALRRRTVSVPIPAPRGQIVDRNGVALAGIRPTLALMITPGDIEKKPEAIARIAELAGLDPSVLAADITENGYRRYLPFVAKLGITREQALAIEERRAFMPGAFIRSESLRLYPAGAAAAHIIGYVGAPNEKDVERIKAAEKEVPSFVGKVGVERIYDDLLIGESGREFVEVDTRGRKMGASVREAPKAGDKLVLTIDASLQRYVTSLLSGRKGAVVALDPRNGEVLCMASSPTYDPNLFAQRAPREKLVPVLTSESQPMHNRAVGSAYAPGSTFKIATLIAGVRAGVVSPSTTFTCTGSIRVGNRSFRCLGHHGRIDYATALEKSCNVFFMEVGRRVDREGIAAAAHDLGLGNATGIDLVGERGGSIPDENWLKKRDLKWYPGDTVNMAVGQGYVSTTPLQMATYISAAANSGTAYKPHILRSRVDSAADAQPQFTKPEKLLDIRLDSEWWPRIQRALLRVVTSGTARAAQVPGITVAGKTGSAEHRRGRASHSWFIAYAPAENPTIAIAVVMETAGHGGEVAAPMARKIIERYLKGTPKESGEEPTLPSRGE